MATTEKLRENHALTLKGYYILFIRQSFNEFMLCS